MNCVTETGWTCNGGSPSGPDTCTPNCGDGLKFSPPEGCDDGNFTQNSYGYGCVGCTDNSALDMQWWNHYWT